MGLCPSLDKGSQRSTETRGARTAHSSLCARARPRDLRIAVWQESKQQKMQRAHIAVSHPAAPYTALPTQKQCGAEPETPSAAARTYNKRDWEGMGGKRATDFPPEASPSLRRLPSGGRQEPGPAERSTKVPRPRSRPCCPAAHLRCPGAGARGSDRFLLGSEWFKPELTQRELRAVNTKCKLRPVTKRWCHCRSSGAGEESHCNGRVQTQGTCSQATKPFRCSHLL